MSSFELNKCYKEVEKCENQLVLALQKLSSIASKIYGKEIEASICVDGEIEFRLCGEEYLIETTIDELMQKAERGDSEKKIIKNKQWKEYPIHLINYHPTKKKYSQN